MRCVTYFATIIVNLIMLFLHHINETHIHMPQCTSGSLIKTDISILDFALKQSTTLNIFKSGINESQ